MLWEETHERWSSTHWYLPLWMCIPPSTPRGGYSLTISQLTNHQKICSSGQGGVTGRWPYISVKKKKKVYKYIYECTYKNICVSQHCQHFNHLKYQIISLSLFPPPHTHPNTHTPFHMLTSTRCSGFRQKNHIFPAWGFG